MMEPEKRMLETLAYHDDIPDPEEDAPQPEEELSHPGAAKHRRPEGPEEDFAMDGD